MSSLLKTGRISAILLWTLVCIKTAGAACGDTIPRPIGFVNDFEHLFTAEQQDTLENMLHRFEQRTTIEIALVTIDTSLTLAPNFDLFTLKMMDAWGVGKKDKNNGILIGISRGYRRIRIQKGSGIAKALTNAGAKQIIEEAFIPFFRKDQYYAGTVNGLKALMQRFE